MDIECNAYPDEIYEGTVSAITTSADSSYSTTVNYPVTVRIEGDTGRLYGGMTADITFVTDSMDWNRRLPGAGCWLWNRLPGCIWKQR